MGSQATCQILETHDKRDLPSALSERKLMQQLSYVFGVAFVAAKEAYTAQISSDTVVSCTAHSAKVFSPTYVAKETGTVTTNMLPSSLAAVTYQKSSSSPHSFE